MKLGEFIALAAVSGALVAVGAAAAWFKRDAPAAPEPPSAAANTFTYESFTPAQKELGFIDQWRFDSCMTDAAKNPTAHGVNTAARVCRRRFDQ